MSSGFETAGQPEWRPTPVARVVVAVLFIAAGATAIASFAIESQGLDTAASLLGGVAAVTWLGTQIPGLPRGFGRTTAWAGVLFGLVYIAATLGDALT